MSSSFPIPYDAGQPGGSPRETPPPIGIHRPDETGPPRGLSPRMTLCEFFEAFVLRRMQNKDLDASTIGDYGQSLKYWKRFTGDPPLEAVDQSVCDEYLARVKRLPGRRGNQVLSPMTVRKHCRNVQRCLELAGPKYGPRQIVAAKRGLFGLDEDGDPRDPPRLEPPDRVEDEAENVFTLHEIASWLDVCDQAIAPRIPGLTPGSWWRSLVIYCYNVGVRIGTALRVTYAMHRADDDGRTWVHVPPKKKAIKGRRGERFYVNRSAWEAIEAIRTDRDLVFLWPHHRRHLDTVRVKLLTMAGIPLDRQFGFHGVRKAFCTEMAEDNPMVAQKQAGHAGMAITRDVYCNRRMVAGSMEKLRQPKRRNRVGKDDPRQKRLFD